jgi:hypothetical protein
MVFFFDNKSIIRLSKNLILHSKTKHIEVKFHFLRDLINDGTNEIIYYKSEEPTANIFNKSLILKSFVMHKKLLSVYTKNIMFRGESFIAKLSV